MKKLFMFLAVAGLATFGAACSSSDDSNPPVAEKQLTLEASATAVKVNESVNFTVKAEGAVQADAKLTIEGKEVSGLSQKFDKVGTYKVVAKKAGFKDSGVVTITVTADGVDPVVKTLVLTATPATIELNAETVFKVTLDGADVTSTSTIKVDGVAVTGGKYKGTAAGTYTAVASKEGSNNSNVVTIVVKPADVVVPTENFLKIDNAFIDLKGSALYQYFKVGGVNHNTITFQNAVYARFDFITITREMNGEMAAVDFENYIALTVYVKQTVAVGAEVTNQNVVRPWQALPADVLFGGSDGAIGGVPFTGDQETSVRWAFSAPTEGVGAWLFSIEGGGTDEGNTLDADFEGPYEGYYNIVAQPTAARTAKNFTSVTELKKSTKSVKLIKGAKRATK